MTKCLWWGDFCFVLQQDISSRWCKKAFTTSQRLQMSLVEIGDEHIFKLKIHTGTWSYLLSRCPWIALFFFFNRRHKFGPKGLFALTRRFVVTNCLWWGVVRGDEISFLQRDICGDELCVVTRCLWWRDLFFATRYMWWRKLFVVTRCLWWRDFFL